jgi:hypothetical protein
MQTGQLQERARRSTRCWVRAVASWNPQVGQLAIQMPPSRWRAGSGAGPGSRPGRCRPGLTGMGDWLCIRVPLGGAQGCSPHRRGADCAGGRRAGDFFPGLHSARRRIRQGVSIASPRLVVAVGFRAGLLARQGRPVSLDRGRRRRVKLRSSRPGLWPARSLRRRRQTRYPGGDRPGRSLFGRRVPGQGARRRGRSMPATSSRACSTADPGPPSG